MPIINDMRSISVEPLYPPLPSIHKLNIYFLIINTAVPPDILDADTSKDITVSEGQNASLYCAATGNPQPSEFNPI